MFDEDTWLAPKDNAGDEEEVVTEVLDDAVVTKDMTSEQRYSLLKTRYPEFDYLVDEFSELRTELVSLQQEAEGKPAKSLETVKAWILGCYVASLASYFAVLTSPARDEAGPAKALAPSELRDHEVMETLMKCREAWLKAKSFRTSRAANMEAGMLSPPEEDEDVDLMDEDMPTKMTVKEKKLSKAALKARKKKEEERAKKALAVEQSLADLSSLLKGSRASSKLEKAAASSDDEDMGDNRSDFGEEDVMDARTADEKARRKKTLKFYTSQIVQKASKRAGASRDAGGDMDIPYRERLVSHADPMPTLRICQLTCTEGQSCPPQPRGRAPRQERRETRHRARGRRRQRRRRGCAGGARRRGRVLRHGGARCRQEEVGQGGPIRRHRSGAQGRARGRGDEAGSRRQAADHVPDPEEQGAGAASQEGGAQPARQEAHDVRGQAEEVEDDQGDVQGRRGPGRIPGRDVGYQDGPRQEYQVVEGADGGGGDAVWSPLGCDEACQIAALPCSRQRVGRFTALGSTRAHYHIRTISWLAAFCMPGFMIMPWSFGPYTPASGHMYGLELSCSTMESLDPQPQNKAEKVAKRGSNLGCVLRIAYSF